jgi:hypothetical protein
VVVPVVFGSSKGGALVPVDGRVDAFVIGVLMLMLMLLELLLRLFSAAFWIMTAVEAAMVPMKAFLPIDADAAAPAAGLVFVLVFALVLVLEDDDFMDMEKALLVGRGDDTNTTAATEHKTLFFEIILLVFLSLYLLL